VVSSWEKYITILYFVKLFTDNPFFEIPTIRPAAPDFQFSRRKFGATGAIDSTGAGTEFGRKPVIKFVMTVAISCRFIGSKISSHENKYITNLKFVKSGQGPGPVRREPHRPGPFL